ncbi:MAG: glycoside hydrolase family 25 protein [Lachnospiraceae bacterium]|nr:glycoside hydrolase family 25 protein [Lachnospiraceae bacterium]
MAMFDDHSYNEGVNVGKRIALGSVLASAAVLLILGVTVAMNGNKKHSNNTGTNPYVKSEEKSTESTETFNNKRTSDQLSFWNMYDEEKSEEIVVSENKNENKKPESVSKNKAKEKKSVSENKETVSENTSSEKFNISAPGEKPEYVYVDPTIPKAELIEDNFSISDNRLVYSQGGRNVSHFGIDVSKYNGSVSWNKVKKAGVEYALIRVGARGYSTGNIVLDENFSDNLQGCIDNGIDVGVYFFSQAINTNEAIEEANYCVAALGGKVIRYPIIFDSEKILNDNYRTENLSSTELTEIFKAFADVVKAYGYTPMFAGTKEQLAKKVDLMNMKDYDIWLLDPGDKTEYPYRYCIRQYSDKGTVDGINGNVDLNICLISYAEK